MEIGEKIIPKALLKVLCPSCGKQQVIVKIEEDSKLCKLVGCPFCKNEFNPLDNIIQEDKLPDDVEPIILTRLPEKDVESI